MPIRDMRTPVRVNIGGRRSPLVREFRRLSAFSLLLAGTAILATTAMVKPSLFARDIHGIPSNGSVKVKTTQNGDCTVYRLTTRDAGGWSQVVEHCPAPAGAASPNP